MLKETMRIRQLRGFGYGVIFLGCLGLLVLANAVAAETIRPVRTSSTSEKEPSSAQGPEGALPRERNVGARGPAFPCRSGR